MLSSQLAFLPLHLDLHRLELDAIFGSSFASPERKLALLSMVAELEKVQTQDPLDSGARCLVRALG